MPRQRKISLGPITRNYSALLSSVGELLQRGRRMAAHVFNAVLTSTYWQIGARIIEYEQQGRDRARYGERLLGQLSKDLTARFGRGFSVDNLESMRLFYLAYPQLKKSETLSRISVAAITETPSRKSALTASAATFPLPWSQYIMLEAE